MYLEAIWAIFWEAIYTLEDRSMGNVATDTLRIDTSGLPP